MNREKRAEILRQEKQKKNLCLQEENLQKQLDKEFRVKQIAQLQENKIIETRNLLNEKDKKVEEFMKQKKKMNDRKQLMSEQINQQKQQYQAQFENIFNKKTIDNETLDMIREMFPNNKQLEKLIEEYNSYK